MSKSCLYYGDNLEILRRYIEAESVDLIYLDPPFKSSQNYNILFEERNGSRSKAQIKAFEDTWTWDQEAAAAYQEIVESGPEKVSRAMQAFRKFLGENDMMAYLAMMAPRLVELRRVLKPTGSIYLHCDPTAGHYLKMLMDAVFGPENFLSEIIWKRTSAHSRAKRYGPVHDVILFFAKSKTYNWQPQYGSYDPDYIRTFFEQTDPDGRRWKRGDLTGPGTRTGECSQSWRGIDVTAKGRHWQPASYLYDKYRKMTGYDLAKYPLLERLDKLDEIGLIHWPDKAGGMPRYKCYLEDMPGVPLQDVWVDIHPIHNLAEERLGYPTQKPEILLERIIKASSNEGDIVLDPFCGCGTTIAVAERLKRHWVGIDITYLAIALMKHRLQDAFGNQAKYQVIGEPVCITGARALAKQDPFQFQFWALGLVGARPTEQKKGKDKGIDGRIYFHDDRAAKKTKQIILSVKSGHTGPAHIRDLRGVVEREKAAIGVLITLQKPTKDMKKEAATADHYNSPWGRHPKLQILTVEEILKGKRIDCPPLRHASSTFKRAPKAKGEAAETLDLPLA